MGKDRSHSAFCNSLRSLYSYRLTTQAVTLHLTKIPYLAARKTTAFVLTVRTYSCKMKIACYVLLCLAGSSAANAQQQPSLRGDVGANNRLLQQKEQNNMKQNTMKMKIEDAAKDAAKDAEKAKKDVQEKVNDKAMKFKEEKVEKVKALKADKKPPAEKMMKEQPKKIATTRNPQCKNCSNTRPPPMVARGRTCETATDAIAWRCEGDPLWRKNTWCERSCYEYGTPLDRSSLPCCEPRFGKPSVAKGGPSPGLPAEKVNKPEKKPPK